MTPNFSKNTNPNLNRNQKCFLNFKADQIGLPTGRSPYQRKKHIPPELQFRSDFDNERVGVTKKIHPAMDLHFKKCECRVLCSAVAEAARAASSGCVGEKRMRNTQSDHQARLSRSFQLNTLTNGAFRVFRGRSPRPLAAV